MILKFIRDMFFALLGMVLFGLVAVVVLRFLFAITFPNGMPIGHYQVDETLHYAAWYFVDTLQDDLRNQFQR